MNTCQIGLLLWFSIGFFPCILYCFFDYQKGFDLKVKDIFKMLLVTICGPFIHIMVVQDVYATYVEDEEWFVKKVVPFFKRIFAFWEFSLIKGKK